MWITLENSINQCLPQQIYLFRKTRSPIAALVLWQRNGQRKDYAPAGEEVPYAMTVEIEDFKDSGKSLHMQALILVEREGQKRIVIGNKGSRLKLIGQQAFGYGTNVWPQSDAQALGK